MCGQEANVEQTRVHTHKIYENIFQQHEIKVIWRINPLECLSAYWCVCVCVCGCSKW